MGVTRATFARSVTYTVSESHESNPSSHLEWARRRHNRASSHSSSVLTNRQRRNAREAATTVEETTDIFECARCQVEMRVVPSAVRKLHYLVCPKCQARFASSYPEAVSPRAGVRHRDASQKSRPLDTDRWRTLKARAEAFHRRVEESDPYRVLGLEPKTPFPEVRAHYHELAARHHPDHGGDPNQMRRIIHAYERIRAMVARAAVPQGEAERREPRSYD